MLRAKRKRVRTLATTTPTAAWPSASLLPPLPQTTSLEIYDLRAALPDVVLSVSTLAGLVNRGPAKIYFIENEDDEFWLQQLDPALPRVQPPVAAHDLLDHLLSIHREPVAGLIIYDPGLPDTRNVASTLAALRSGLVVSPELAASLQQAPYHLPILADLRSHGWKSRLQAYIWAYRHLLPECSSDLVAGLDPGIVGSLRSFLVAQRVFTCWLDARKIIPEPTAGWRCERGLFKRLLASFHPGTLHLGWFISEPFSIRLTSHAALLTLASDHCTNLTVWSSLPPAVCPPEDTSPAHIAAPTTTSPARPGPGEGRSASDPVLLAQSVLGASLDAEESRAATPSSVAGEPAAHDCTYLSFTISDGDNLQYCQHRLLHLWRDEARGKLPLGWTIAPSLWQTMPPLAAFYRRTATENDVLIAGPSGIAYILPSRWPRPHRVAFLQLTATSLQAMGLTLLQVLDHGPWWTWFSMKFVDIRLQTFFASQLAAHGLRGILSGAGGPFPTWSCNAGLPVYQNLGLALNSRRTLRLIQGALARGTRFINVYIFAWNINPTDLQSIVQQLGPNVRVVTPARLLELIGEANM